MAEPAKPLHDVPSRLAVPIDLSRDHHLGPPEATVTLLEYGDYECPDCGRAYPLLNALQARFASELRFVFRHFPQFTIHRHASVAAQAAEAAGMQGKFWPMHDLLYGHQDLLSLEDLTHHALRLGLEIYNFEGALAAGTYRRRVEQDYTGGQRSGVRGTPTLFINNQQYTGPIEVDAIALAIQNAANNAARDINE